MTFVGLMTVGFVNVVTFFKSDLDSRVKIGLAILFAFALTYVPNTIANDLLERAKQAIEIALTVSGAYKLSQKIGGA